MTDDEIDHRLAMEFEPPDTNAWSTSGRLVSPRSMWEFDDEIEQWVPRPFHDQDYLALLLVQNAQPHPPIWRTKIECMADIVEVHVYDYDDKLIGRGMDDEICSAVVDAYAEALGIEKGLDKEDA